VKSRNVLGFLAEDEQLFDLFKEKVHIDATISSAIAIFGDLQWQDLRNLLSECENLGLQHLKAILKEQEESLRVDDPQLSIIAKRLQDLATLPQESLLQLFSAHSGPLRDQRTDFYNLIDTYRHQWPDTSAESLSNLAQKIFISRFTYHCSTLDSDCGLSYIPFVTSFLTVTLQSVIITMEHAERTGNGFSFYNFICNSLLSASVKVLLNRNDGSPEFYRNIFHHAAHVDDWINSVEFLQITNLSERLFDVVGREWVNVEVKKMKSIWRKALTHIDRDFSVTLCSALADLVEVAPENISEAQKKLFHTCWIKAQNYLGRKLMNFVCDDSTFSELCEIANAFRLLSIKFMEIYEVFDGLPEELVSNTRLAKSRCLEICEKMSIGVYDVFESKGKDYLLSSALSWKNGRVTPSLAKALEAVQEPLAVVRNGLEERLFSNHFLPDLVKMIDKKVYTLLGKRIPWNEEGAVEQFVVDLKGMVEVFGGDDFRLLRSAKILLTQDEASERIDHELSEDDVEYFISVKSMM
jgi:hypothetical protein